MALTHNRMPIYDYSCKQCNHLEPDLFRPVDERIIPCPKCGGEMARRICAPKLSVTRLATGKNASQDAIDKWDRMRRKKMAIEQRNMRNHGTYE